MRKTGIIIGVLSIVLIFASLFSLVNASTVENLLVGSGQQEVVPINLLAPQTVTGSLNVSGTGRNDTVDFWVRNPNGATILDDETAANGKTSLSRQVVMANTFSTSKTILPTTKT